MPTRAGTVLEYDWRTSTRSGRAVLSLASARSAGSEAILTWRVEGEDSFSIERRCDDSGAEEPWVALGTVAAVELRSQSGRLPRDLALGTRYAGALEMALGDFVLEIERSHTVTGRESIELGSRTYDAWRVDAEDETLAGSAGVRSVAWIAPEVGLVRLVLGEGDAESTFDLRGDARN